MAANASSTVSERIERAVIVAADVVEWAAFSSTDREPPRLSVEEWRKLNDVLLHARRAIRAHRGIEDRPASGPPEDRAHQLAAFVAAYVAADTAFGADAIRRTYAAANARADTLAMRGWTRDELQTIGRAAVQAAKRHASARVRSQRADGQ